MTARACLVRVSDDADRYELQPNTITIGRKESCDIVCQNSNVSGIHARISPVDVETSLTDFTVEDLGSNNGTRVNFRRLTGDERFRLHHEDIICLGKSGGSDATHFKFLVLQTVEDFRDNVLRTYGRKRKHSSDHTESLTARLWLERKFCDSTITCNGQRFEVHRAILAAASPVFEAMFSSGMREGLQSSMELQSHSIEAVEAMLAYIYTGQLCPDCDPGAVLCLADQYALDSLAEDCAAALLRRMSSANAVSIIRAVRPFMDRPSVRPIWEGIRNSFRVLAAQDDLMDEVISLI